MRAARDFLDCDATSCDRSLGANWSVGFKVDENSSEHAAGVNRDSGNTIWNAGNLTDSRLRCARSEKISATGLDGQCGGVPI